MNKKATFEQVNRYNELTDIIKRLEAEKDELKQIILLSADAYGKTDKDNMNKRTFSIGDKCTVTVTTVISPYFDTKSFKEKHPKLFDEFYTGTKVSERIKTENK